MSDKNEISYESFCQIRDSSRCTATSAWYIPNLDKRAYSYRSTVAEFLSECPYSCRCTNSDRTDFTNYDSPDAHATKFTDLLKSPRLVEILSRERSEFIEHLLESAPILTLHCSGCDRRVIVDGLHRLVRMAVERRYSAVLQVTELSGREWQPDTPDLNLVCECSTLI